jgi:hypothetical protein
VLLMSWFPFVDHCSLTASSNGLQSWPLTTKHSSVVLCVFHQWSFSITSTSGSEECPLSNAWNWLCYQILTIKNNGDHKSH